MYPTPKGPGFYCPSQTLPGFIKEHAGSLGEPSEPYVVPYGHAGFLLENAMEMVLRKTGIRSHNFQSKRFMQ